MNKVYLIGRLATAPQNRQTPNGISVTTFDLAVTRRSNRDNTDFFKITTWRGLAETCAKYLEKGQQAAIVGELQTRSYEDKSGAKRTAFDIVADDVEFLGKAKQAEQPSGRNRDTFAETIGADEMEVEDLPF